MPAPLEILVVEDDASIRATLVEQLAAAGHRVDSAADGVDGLARAVAGRHDLVVLDLGLPRLDGLELARGVRAALGRRTSILMLTARDTLEEKLAGFDAGADDYLVKPFAMPELLARVRVLGQRTAEPDARSGTLRVADLELDPRLWTARRGARELTLNRVGFRLLRALMERSPAVLTREECEQLLWDGFSPGGSVLRTHVYALRRAVDLAGEPPLVHTVRGVGYRVAAEGP